MIDACWEKFTNKLAGLAFRFEVNPLSCGNPEHFAQYIRFCAISDNKAGRSVTHVLLNKEKEVIVGYISLKASSLLTEIEVRGKQVWTGEPALEIAELAVHKNYERQGVGRALIDIAITVATQTNDIILGIRHLVLAADPKAVPFYERMGFSPIRDYFHIPQDAANAKCVPMFMQLY